MRRSFFRAFNSLALVALVAAVLAVGWQRHDDKRHALERTPNSDNLAQAKSTPAPVIYVPVIRTMPDATETATPALAGACAPLPPPRPARPARRKPGPALALLPPPPVPACKLPFRTAGGACLIF